MLGFDKNLPQNLRNLRAMAAVELLAATRDPAYDAAFQQSSELVKKGELRYLDQLGADFAYARLPDDVGDPELKKQAIDLIAAYADHAIEFSRKNAFDIITGHRTDMPMIFVSRFFSTPGAGGMALIYAYELTKKPAYLAAAVQGANYSLGANPDNLSYCTGVGDNAQHFNFIVDAHCHRPTAGRDRRPHSLRAGQRGKRDEPRGERLGPAVAAELRSGQEDDSQLVRLARERAVHRLRHLPAAQRELLQPNHRARGVLLVLAAYAAGGGEMKAANAMVTSLTTH